jgi:hypothetical protein
MRDFLHSEVAQIYRIPNIPDEPDLAIEVGRRLCEDLLEPLEAQFGRLAIRSGYRSSALNELCNRKRHNCASNEKNYAAHIWDRLDNEGNRGATACVVIPSLAGYLEHGGDWRELAWYIHDTLPYSSLCFFPKLGAFNIRWRDNPVRRIDSYATPKGMLTAPGMPNHQGSHADYYRNSRYISGEP